MKVLYFIDGPLDLTKKLIEDSPAPRFRVASYPKLLVADGGTPILEAIRDCTYEVQYRLVRLNGDEIFIAVLRE